MGFGTRYLLLASGVTLLTIAVGSVLVGPGESVGVIAGAGLGLLVQAGVVWIFGVLLFPARRLLLLGFGMATRLFCVVLVALVASPLGLPLAPTLFTLVAVFFLTTLLEPVLFQLETQSAS
jgi:hypothetical protein